MENQNFNDMAASDSDDSQFGGFDPVELNDAEFDEINMDNVELDDEELQEIIYEIDREDRDVFFESFDSDWLRNFDTVPGPTYFDDDATPCDIFKTFFDDEVMNLLVFQTNLYYEQYIQSKEGLDNLPRFSRERTWTPVSLNEMKVFVAMLLFMGLVRMPNYDMYWSTHDLVNLKTLTACMTRDRFLNIISFLHACDNSMLPPRDSPNYDPGYKIREISSLLIGKWQAAYKPKREIAIDETLVPFKGRTKLLQYIPSKPHKWGIKIWTLADSKSGYVWNWQLYTGKAAADPQGRGVAHRVVMSLCEPLLNLGHHVFCDNFFTSPALFQELADNQTGACGTLRANRVGVPRVVKTAKPKAGEPAATCRDGHLLYITWQDKRLVHLLTSVHNGSSYTKRVRSRFHQNFAREVEHPKAIQLYTHFMGGVDLADQQTQYCVLQHKMLKWWKKLLICNLLEVSLVNAKVIYKELAANKNKRVKTDKFRLSIIQSLLEGCDKPNKPFRRPISNPSARLTDKHFPGVNPKLIGGGRKSNPDCEVCSDRSRKRHQTKFFCAQCAKPMCAYPCFERYHTLQNYKINCSKDLHN